MPFPVDEVLGKIQVTFFGHPNTAKNKIFVRQRFSRATAAFTTLREEHFECTCNKDVAEEEYLAGETVLVERFLSLKQLTLEPVQLMDPVSRKGEKHVLVRKLLRKGRDYNDPQAEPNELVYTQQVETVLVDDIKRRCHVRFYSPADLEGKPIPTPYSRGGVGDAFYIVFEAIASESPSRRLRPMGFPYPTSFKQGFDPSTDDLKMNGLDLFCGGGSFGRGVEEGGAVVNKWAVDYDRHACYTYRANLNEDDEVGIFFGSADDFLARALAGEHSQVIPRPKDVHCILAGSPCQGFSNANLFRLGDGAQRNVSKVALVAACIDFFRPNYAILENVPTMAKCAPKDRKHNVFAQFLCSLVGMGYQVTPYHLDAWSYGAPQSRSRVFVAITAPGLSPLPPPPITHSHHEGARTRTLGTASNGLPFGERTFGNTTTFEYPTIGQATADLPAHRDGRDTSVMFPDHRTSRVESAESLARITCIPEFPRHSTLNTAYKAGLVPRVLYEAYEAHAKNPLRNTDTSKAWGRTRPDALVPTITTACRPADAFTGRILHWSSNRTLTVQEARRAQGYPDRDVLVGSPAMQWKIIGNSVVRNVGLACGMCLRLALLENVTANRGMEGMAKSTLTLASKSAWPRLFNQSTTQSRSTRPSTAISVSDSETDKPTTNASFSRQTQSLLRRSASRSNVSESSRIVVLDTRKPVLDSKSSSPSRYNPRKRAKEGQAKVELLTSEMMASVDVLSDSQSVSPSEVGRKAGKRRKVVHKDLDSATDSIELD
jgi:DNA (cytosine-5)-methyltransferase 1